MADVMVPSKRARAPSFGEKHPECTAGLIQEKEMAQVQVRNFLEQCRFCKKKLRHDEDVFMYGYFGAFCSKECRAKQMGVDIFTESSVEMAKAKKGRLCGTKPKESKDEALGNPDKITTLRPRPRPQPQPQPQFYIS